ncbi:MAG: hypothetical protein GX892_08385 [Thermoanaerobacteraceae bacterium]|nr:hypothetical protein [Thermoanaerobacteraceae bacterium]
MKYVFNSSDLQTAHDNIASLVIQIKEIDDKNLKIIKTLFSKLKQDIAKLKQTENALKGYGIVGTDSRDGAFIDTKR